MSFITLLDRNGKPVVIEMNDVLSVTSTSDGPVFHTRVGQLYYPTTLEELQTAYSVAGFERLDRTNLVNLNQVQAFDQKARRVYFDNPWDKESKFATVSEANVHKVEHLTKEETAAYKPARKPLFGRF
ncbi:LytTR family transcriptional regulator DNA-binding domain-containing protein [Cohnella faecalis]|uniref:HTH LytTR-type domain-containing protein n=1 Tax=Cohnella faecalis TaxID=2315694 RepID=A0A398CL28_9BACL|nr:LytTR family transcriptional regulator DNA-binding domain-containing protein [Cohnella faecalis]RIE04036.1 hypothetical protein D3H35_08775 [Cohnella faecalis]